MPDTAGVHHGFFKIRSFSFDPQLNLAQQEENNDDKHYQADPSGGSISPRPAMRPDRDYSYKHQYQYYDYDCANGHDSTSRENLK
jgi:hypothetical protein